MRLNRFATHVSGHKIFLRDFLPIVKITICKSIPGEFSGEKYSVKGIVAVNRVITLQFQGCLLPLYVSLHSENTILN